MDTSIFDQALRTVYGKAMANLWDPRHNERLKAIAKRQRAPYRRGFEYIDQLARGVKREVEP